MAFMWCHQGMKNFLSWGHWGHCWGRHWGPFWGRFGGCFCRFINASSIVSALLRCQTWHCRHGWRKSLCMKKKRKFFVSNSDQLWCPLFKEFSSLEFIKGNSRVFLLRQISIVNYYVKSLSNSLSNENIKTGVFREKICISEIVHFGILIDVLS